MGCLFAARLAAGGIAVTLVDVDHKRLDLINAEGIQIHDDDGTRTAAMTALAAPKVQGRYDLILLFTKGMHSAAAIASIAHIAHGPVPVPVLTLQNGIGNAEQIAAIFPQDDILVGITDFPADLNGPNQVSSHGSGHVRLGGFTQTAHSHAEAVADLLNAGGLNASVDGTVMVAIWEKLAFNAALNSLATVSGCTVGEMDVPAGHEIIAAIVGEVVAVAHARGIAVERHRIEAKIAFALARHRNHKASMLQDRLAGRRTEIHSINGAVVDCAREAGMAVPVTQALANLVRMGEPEL
jgi:2-dehydropantoate 2-reductase